MKKLILTIIFISSIKIAIAGEIALIEIDTSKITTTALNTAKTKIINAYKNHWQPSMRYRMQNMGDGKIAIRADAKLLNLTEVKNAIDSGKAKLITVYEWNDNGYIYDSRFKKMQDYFGVGEPKYTVGVSTP